MKLLGAGDRVRTGDIQLGRLTLYQLSYSRVSDGKYKTTYIVFPNQIYNFFKIWLNLNSFRQISLTFKYVDSKQIPHEDHYANRSALFA